MKTLLLTGGSSGIGKATAELFAAHGWRVFELSRHGQSSERITHVDCDVTSEDSVHTAVETVLSEVDTLDVVISNAGYGISGAIEYTKIADAQSQFDVNFFGALRLVQAVLPQLRKQHRGHIIFTSSVAAVLSIPYQSFYSASKAAINSLALALQNEVRPFGIRVAVLMPGDVATGFTQAREKSEVGNQVYERMHNAVSAMERDEKSGMTPEQMARDFYRIAMNAFPKPQHVGGFKYKIFCFLDRVLPKRTVNWIVGLLY